MVSLSIKQFIKIVIKMKKLIILVIACWFGSGLFGQQGVFLLRKPDNVIKVVIGDTLTTTTPGNYGLYVQNGVLTERVKVSLKSTTDWSDDAFAKTPTLESVSKSIDEKSHLVEMPSADQLVKNGYELKEMDAKLLQQIEWLWQHMIALRKENELLKQSILEIKKEKKD
jgi:trimeric autotransporter adhesin